MPTALVVIDMQRAFLEGDHATHARAGVQVTVRHLLAAARTAEALVIHLQNDDPAGAPDEPETAGWELAVSPAPGEAVLRKSRDDGFIDTDLGPMLDRHRVTSVAVAGLLSEMCVATTARSAMTRGLNVVLPRGAHGTYDIPEDDSPRGVPVSALQVARVAESSLGDEVVILPAEAVQFAPATPPQS
ncbi:isochorismatase family protein [Nocardioides sp. YIM 123512]|uniref:Isochorismatase family protein n=2 Tax=Nocardioides flavescens TaxID=2691959 RepID=A0A6L7EWL5_9ACTN|nr:isochorismatase family protein [Nocardioides flavescens]MXG88605.1 isochorismatase family protein [Nocardioides flavescens]